MIEYKRKLKKFDNLNDYETQKGKVMGIPHVVLLEDTNEVIFASKNNENEIDYALEFFTIEALEEGTVGIGIPPSATSLKYRKNNELWIETSEAIQLSVVANDTIQISCVSDSFNNGCSSPFAVSAPFNVKGNIMSLLYGDNFKGQIDLSGKYEAFLSLFFNCATLQNAENLILPATTLADFCYYHMFDGCTSLTTSPELPATTLANNCYQNMFFGCTNLTEAPQLPATTLVNDCYSYMFSICTSLTTAPQLPATTLASYCYYEMFRGCSKLRYIKMLATDISATDCLFNWVNGVASIGTFVKNANMTSLPSGTSGIPNGWTVENT